MVLYNFKTICVVPSAKDFIDIILSRTQRKTPTVVHKGYKISRIRSFYMRKVKFTQDNYNEKLSQLLDEFPKLDDIHPFYADLINVLYSRDHYKLALGQVNTARQLIDNIGKDYLKMLKFADSLYRCKELKRAALGRMCTVMKKLNASLCYLEEVRQHLSRLPAIDPNTRTLMITGYPNVGKSSFINKLSRANVQVEPYAFTTKSLFVGHTDYKYMRWQIIDTPGILDHPLEERNTIEMQAITALAHLHSTVLYFIDISETCGYSIKQQVELYHSIKPLFGNKPLLVVCNKIDLKKIEDLDEEDRGLIESVRADKDTQIMPMSNISEMGINTVKETACNMLLEHRVERKLRSKRINDVINRIHVAQPVKRDNKKRGTAIPESVMQERAGAKRGVVAPKRKTEKDLEAENGGAGIYSVDLKKYYTLKHDEWKYDIIPEIMDGKNIADFVDPEIDARLAELEKEEEEQQRKAAEAAEMEDEEDELDEGQRKLVDKIREKRKIIIAKRLVAKSNNKPVLPRTATSKSMQDADKNLTDLGLDTTKLKERASNSRGRKRTRSEHGAQEEDDDDEDMDGPKKKKGLKRGRSKSRADAREAGSSASNARDLSRPRDASSYRDQSQQREAEKMSRKVQKKLQRHARAGEADRKVLDEKPKHLFSGKRGIGKTDRR